MSRLSRPDALFHSSHLGPEFRVLISTLSVPNRVWDAMGSPCLTYLASYSSRGAPSWFYHLKPCVCICRVAPGRYSLNNPGQWGHGSLLVNYDRLRTRSHMRLTGNLNLESGGRDQI